MSVTAAPTDRVVLLRDWPGLVGWSAQTEPTAPVSRLWQRGALVLQAAARRDAVPECFGLGAALVVAGRSVVAGCLIVPDDLAETDSAALVGITRWADAHSLGETAGCWRVVTLSSFFDPFATVEAQPWAFQPNAYSGAGFVVGADLGRTLGLSAEYVVERTGRSQGSWEIYPPGWGVLHERNRIKRSSPHRPPIRLTARRVGWQVEFGPCGKDAKGKAAGKVRKGRVWRGAFVDLASAAYTFDADRGASVAEHCEDFGFSAVNPPVTVEVEESGAEEMAHAAQAIHAFALVLDDEAGRWFSTSLDRREQRGRVDLVRTASPGALAAQIPSRFRIRPPLSLRVGAEEHRRWAEASYGGWCEADRRLLGVPFPAVSADVTSAYPLVAHRLGWWDLMCANAVRRDDVSEILRQLCVRALADPEAVLAPEVWSRFGATLVEVVPDGERFPVAIEDVRRPDGRMEAVALSSPGRPMFYAWPDVVAAAMVSCRVPRIITATRYVPVGRQAKMRRRLPVLPGLVLDVERDPVLELVRHRQKVKGRDYRLAATLRVVANSLVYGNPSRFDDVTRRERRHWVLTERPGPWTFLPISASVSAGARLLLAVCDRLVSDLGGVVAYRDTDSALIPSTPDGDRLDLTHGSRLRALPWAEVDEVLHAFDPLSPAPCWPVWKRASEKEGRPLSAVAFGPKRHAAFVDHELVDHKPDAADDTELTDATEAHLGGAYADPPAMGGRVGPVNGYRRWSMAAVTREVVYTQARTADPSHALRPKAPWDDMGSPPMPALRRYTVKSPEMARALPGVLGAGPGTRYVMGEVDELHRGQMQTPVAIDPGGDLSHWQDLEWVDMVSGEALRVTTDPMDDSVVFAEPDAVLLATLDLKAAAWGRVRHDHIEAVTVDPARVRRVGRVSGVLDAHDDGRPGDLATFRPNYRLCACGCGASLDRAGGARYIDDEHGREARNQRRRKKTTITVPICTCGCRTPLPPGRKDRLFVSDAHRKAAARRRTHEKGGTR